MLALENVMFKPDAGAGALRVAVAVDVSAPPRTEFGESVRLIEIALTVTLTLRVVKPVFDAEMVVT